MVLETVGCERTGASTLANCGADGTTIGGRVRASAAFGGGDDVSGTSGTVLDGVSAGCGFLNSGTGGIGGNDSAVLFSRAACRGVSFFGVLGGTTAAGGGAGGGKVMPDD